MGKGVRNMTNYVVPLVGTWIEIPARRIRVINPAKVVPLVGTWIEIQNV